MHLHEVTTGYDKNSVLFTKGKNYLIQQKEMVQYRSRQTWVMWNSRVPRYTCLWA